MMVAAGGVPLLRPLTVYPNINVRELAKAEAEIPGLSSQAQ